MLTLPVTLMRWIVRFAPLLSKRVWAHAQVLVVGALLAPGQRTVTAVLRVLGLEQEPHFQTYHRGLESRAVVECGGGSRVIGRRGGNFCGHRSCSDWARRYGGAAVGGENQGPRDLSRPGAVVALAADGDRSRESP
jgi:hypothetical protein